MNPVTSSSAAALALVLCLPAAHADVLVDNLSQPIRDTSTLPGDLWAAQSFVSGADPVRLLGIEIPIGLVVGDRNIVADLHADAGPSQVGAHCLACPSPTARG